MTRVVVVAGASSDTGKAIAAALAESGSTVVAVGSNAGRLADVDAHVRMECDLADPAAVQGLAERVRAEFGAIDGLIHLPGGWRGGQSDEDFDWIERRTLTTLRNTSRAFHDDLSASDAGRLAIISSSVVDKPTWSSANYATVKSAAEAWVAAVASGWRKAGTAAAVRFVVASIGPDGTPEATIADHVVRLWDRPASELNGIRIRL